MDQTQVSSEDSSTPSDFVISVRSNRPMILMIVFCVLGLFIFYEAQRIENTRKWVVVLLYMSGTLLLSPSLFIFFSLYHALLKPIPRDDMISETA